MVSAHIQGRVSAQVRAQVRASQAMKTTNTSVTAPLDSPANIVKHQFLAFQIHARIQEHAKTQKISMNIHVRAQLSLLEETAKLPFHASSVLAQRTRFFVQIQPIFSISPANATLSTPGTCVIKLFRVHI